MNPWIKALALPAWMAFTALAARADDQAPPAPAPSTPPSLEAFARLPAMTQLKLSPNGQRFAGLLNQDAHTVLVVRDVMGGKLKPVLGSDNKLFTFNWLRWANDGRLVVSLRYASRRDFVETVETRLLSLDPDGGPPVNLVQSSAFRRSRAQQFQDQVIDWMPEDGQHLLLQLRDSDQAIEPSVYEVEVASGRRRLVQQAQKDVLDWTTDAQHRVRVGLAMTRDGEFSVKARAPDGKDWRTLWTFRSHGSDEVWPLGFGLDPQRLYVRAEHQGRAAIFAVRLDQPDLPRTLLLSDAEHDVSGELLHSPANGEVLGLRTASQQGETGEARSELWEPRWKALAKAIDLGLPKRFNRLVDISRDENRYLVFSSGNGQPGEYYIGNRATGDLSLLVETYPDLDAAQLAPKQREKIQARDGLPLNAFLTLPVGYRRGEDGPLPLVLLPHGGPASRDGIDFDNWSTFLASRRYAVLQVNFRGSDGYGSEFRKAGLQRWGLEMQDDLSDAVAWAVQQRIADPARVCIVGGSYGGYAALMGLVKTPGLYRCGVSYAGVTDLQDLISYESDYYGGRSAAEQQIGRYWGDRERLKATSPALQAARIQAPVLLMHGAMDRVVPVAQSRDMAKALKSAGKPYRYVEQADGDHHLSRNANRIEFFRELDAFLAANLGPGS